MIVWWTNQTKLYILNQWAGKKSIVIWANLLLGSLGGHHKTVTLEIKEIASIVFKNVMDSRASTDRIRKSSSFRFKLKR